MKQRPPSADSGPASTPPKPPTPDASAATTTATTPITKTRRPFYRRKWFLWPVGTLITLVIVVLLAFNLSPWPGTMLIRTVFDRGAEQSRAEQARHAPDGGIASIRNESYRSGDKDALLDVFFPEHVSATDQLPLLVWIHGGAWISGDKDDNTPYYEIIASHGYTVISLNYSLGPDKHYPTPVFQINDALAYIQENAVRFHVDPTRIVIAGDSAGAQLTSQIAALVTNPEFAAAMGITPALKPDQLRGVMLNCGIYDMPTFVGQNDPPARTGLEKLLSWGVGTTVWAYTGKKGGAPVAMDQMSTIDHVTADFPPTWISGGNADPLTDKQSKPLADKLESLGVPVTTLFWPADHEPKLSHEYQFQLDNPDAQTALDGMLAFLDQHIGPGSTAGAATPAASPIASPVASPAASPEASREATPNPSPSPVATP